MSHKRIVICGATCSGKTFLRKKLEEKGFHFDVSYTTRPRRPGEIEDVHYKFIKQDAFEFSVEMGLYYEHVEYNGYGYATGKAEWGTSDCFIMETDGIKHIDKTSRKKTFIIYLNPPVKVRKERMLGERGWSEEETSKRLKTDKKKFKDFTDYDLMITNPDF
jgi:guanylate kinase